MGPGLGVGRGVPAMAARARQGRVGSSRLRRWAGACRCWAIQRSSMGRLQDLLQLRRVPPASPGGGAGWRSSLRNWGQGIWGEAARSPPHCLPTRAHWCAWQTSLPSWAGAGRGGPWPAPGGTGWSCCPARAGPAGLVLLAVPDRPGGLRPALPGRLRAPFRERPPGGRALRPPPHQLRRAARGLDRTPWASPGGARGCWTPRSWPWASSRSRCRRAQGPLPRLRRAGLRPRPRPSGWAPRPCWRRPGVALPGRGLFPLVEATVRNIERHGAAGRTGPFVRGDAATIARDAAALPEAWRRNLPPARPALTTEETPMPRRTASPSPSGQRPPLDLAQHEIQVTLTCPPRPWRRGGGAALPAWTRGSYLIRDYARFLDRLTAVDGAAGPWPCDQAGQAALAPARRPGPGDPQLPALLQRPDGAHQPRGRRPRPPGGGGHLPLPGGAGRRGRTGWPSRAGPGTGGWPRPCRRRRAPTWPATTTPWWTRRSTGRLPGARLQPGGCEFRLAVTGEHARGRKPDPGGHPGHRGRLQRDLRRLPVPPLPVPAHLQPRRPRRAGAPGLRLAAGRPPADGEGGGHLGPVHPHRPRVLPRLERQAHARRRPGALRLPREA